MKTLLFSLLLSALAAAQSPSLAGKWQILRNANGNESTQSCTFEQKGGALSGECTSGEQTVKITGKVEGAKLAFTYKTEREGSPVTVQYTGAIQSPDKITGKVLAVEFAVEGDFTATRDK